MQLTIPYVACQILTFHQGTRSAHELQKPAPPGEQCSLASTTSSTATGGSLQSQQPSQAGAEYHQTCRPVPLPQAHASAACVAEELESDAHLGLLGWPSILCFLFLLRAALHRAQEHMRPDRNAHATYRANKCKACSKVHKGAIRTKKLMLAPGSCQCRRRACLGTT